MRARMMALLVIVLGVTGSAFADDVIDGRLGPGALYRMVRPTEWNGSLVLYAHGFTPASAPVALPADALALAPLFTSQGFAVAFSSFSENGWAVKDGAQRTHQLLAAFTSKFGAPTRVYLAGGSMGGLIAIKLAEEHPAAFDGMFLACPVSGGARAQADYQANVRALFDVFYPGVLPGDAGNVPAGVNIPAQIQAPAALAMQSNPMGALAIAQIAQTPVPGATAFEIGQSIVAALVRHAESGTELVPQLHGKPYFDNRGVTYSSALLPPSVVAFVNATVGRFDAAPSALNYLEHYYEPTGALSIPTVMLSDSADPIAPGFHRARYASLVAANGAGDLLVQRTVPRYGHCALEPLEIAATFNQLYGWVEFGVPPAP